MFSGKDAANSAYPTQWALNPTAYQNIDSSQVDWAALAQQWIAMKEAAAIVGPPPPKVDAEEGEAPMEVENPDINCEAPVTPGPDWNVSSNSWGSSWNQWGWGSGWSGSGPVDPKMTSDPSLTMPPLMDGYSDTTSTTPGYTTGNVTSPTFQHGYWTAPQSENSSNNRNENRSRDRRSKSKNRDSKTPRNRSHRDKPPLIPPVIEPIIMPIPAAASTIDAAKRRQLPAWIREGLEKMEREKQRAIEREQEKKAQEEAEIEKKRLEEEELERIKSEAGGQPVLPAKSKFESESEGSPSENERAASPLGRKSREELLQEVMLAVRRSLTEILLEVTDQEIHTVSQEELARYTAAQASRLNAMKASKSKALASIASGLGLGAYESSDDSADEDHGPDDGQLQEIIRRKRHEFERTSREIEAEVRRAELKETGEGTTTPPNVTPERPKRSRSSATPPPIDSETPEKKVERRPSKDKRINHKTSDKIDNRKLDTIQEEKPKKSNKYENTPSPQKSNKASKDGTNSSSSVSDDDSATSNKSSSESVHESKIENNRTKKRKRRSTSSSESHKKSKKHTKDKIIKASEKSYTKSKHQAEHERTEKTKSKKREDYYDKHKSRSRDYEKSHKDKYRDDSDEDRPRKRSKRSRSISYESRSGRRKSRDRSEDRSRRRDKRSYDRDSSKRDRSYDRSGRDYDKYDRYERSRDDRHDSYSRHRR